MFYFFVGVVVFVIMALWTCAFVRVGNAHYDESDEKNNNPAFYVNKIESNYFTKERKIIITQKL